MPDSRRITLIMLDPSEGKKESYNIPVENLARRRRELEAEGFEFVECGKTHLYEEKGEK